MVEIAVASVKLEFPDDAFRGPAGPAGPGGAGVVLNEWAAVLEPGQSVGGIAPYPTSLSLEITPQSCSSRFRLTCTGLIYADGIIVFLDVRRNGESLVAAGQTGMFATSTRGHPNVEPFNFQWTDAPNTVEQVKYELYVWAAVAGSIWFGRRSSNATINCPSVLTVTELCE